MKHGKEKVIEMKFKNFIKEHNRLIKVLESGMKTKQMKEAAEQKKELKKYLKK
jgi:hypothetical protein